jgi:hypothetical protein
VIFNENVLYKIDNFTESLDDTNSITLTYRHNNNNNNIISSDINTKQESEIKRSSIITTTTNSNSDSLNISIKFEASTHDSGIDSISKNELQANKNDRLTITCKKQNFELCSWYHPKGFQIKNSEKFQINSDFNYYK